jgi:hypothetical protein
VKTEAERERKASEWTPGVMVMAVGSATCKLLSPFLTCVRDDRVSACGLLIPTCPAKVSRMIEAAAWKITSGKTG